MSAPPAPPHVSVVIVTCNSGEFLPRCLAALCGQTYQNFEVVVVDNGSSDGCVKDLPVRYPGLSLQLEQLPTNTGFAPANNLGARLARGEWLALLNADAFPEPSWLELLMQAAWAHPSFRLFASRQLQAGDPSRLDGEGDAYHISGYAWRRRYNAPASPPDAPYEVFSPCGAAAVYQRQAFLQAGGFDEDYFAYLEDVDLGFRLRLLGERCLYVPGAAVHHIGSASTGRHSAFVTYHGYRNLIWTYFKDMPSPLFWFYLPAHLCVAAFFLLVHLSRGRGAAAFRGLAAACAGMPRLLQKRRRVQAQARVPWQEINRQLSRGLREPYRELRNRS